MTLLLCLGWHQPVAAQTNVQLSTATIDGATLTLTYSEALDPHSVPAATDFSVTVGNRMRTVWNVLVKGTAVTLTLETSVRRGQGVTLSYTPGVSTIRTVPPLSLPASQLLNESVTNNTSGVPPPGTDRAALFALFQSTGGINWDNRQNWLSNKPLDQWFGVKTNASGRVTHLQLVDNGLRGMIPIEAIDLTSLIRLEVVKNETCVPAEPDFVAYLQSKQFDGAYCPTPESEVDIAIFYTRRARLQHGNDHRFIRAKIDSLIAAANSTFARSGVAIKLFPLLVQEIAYSSDRPGVPLSVHLRRLLNPNDNYLDDVDTQREAVGADIVHLIVNGEGGGVAGVPISISLFSSDAPFSVSTGKGSSGTFTHEIGHTFGLQHDRYVECGTTSCTTVRSYSPTPYGLGYVNKSAFAPGAETRTRWRTIMSYNNQCRRSGFSCQWTNRFSDPTATHRGDPLGVAGEVEGVAGVHGPSDAVRALNNARETVSRYRRRLRDPGVVTPPVVQDPLRLSTATIDGATLTLTYSEALDPHSVPAATDFSVKVGNRTRTVWNVLVKGTAVTLTLNIAAERGQGVTLSYTPGGSWIRTVPPLSLPVSALANESVTNNTPETPPSGTDRAELFALFQATGGMNWHNRQNWLSNKPLHEWFGVRTDYDGRVIGLRLENNGLRGVIPPRVMRLTRLRQLNVALNETCARANPAFFKHLSAIEFDGAYCPTAKSQVDVAVFYTPGAKEKRGSVRLIRAYIDSLITSANSIFSRSGVGIELSPVLVREIAYSGDGPGTRMSTHRMRISQPNDGYMDDAHALRDAVGADIVHLITVASDPPIARGVATIPERISVKSSHMAFSVASHNTTSVLFAHEIGHVFGLLHDRHEQCGSKSCKVGRAVYPYGFGYVNQSAFDGASRQTRWRTVMSYNTQCRDSGFTCVWAPLFSDPTATYRGDPLGVAGEVQGVEGVHGPSDAVRALNNARETVSRYRDAPSSRPVKTTWRFVPAGLAPGDSFRLLLVTRRTRNANPLLLPTYDDHVQLDVRRGHEAIRDHSDHFKALGSTVQVDARDHTGTTYAANRRGVPIYWLGGNRVADDYVDFYDGSWDSNAPTDRFGTPFENPVDVKVFTGSKADGTKFTRNFRWLGTTGEQTEQTRIGKPGVAGKELDWGVENKSTRLPLYALSDVFTVQPSVGLSRIPLSLSIDRNAISMDAGATAVTVTATLRNPTQQHTDFEVEVRAGTASWTEDFAAAPSRIVMRIPAGRTTVKASFTLTPVDREGPPECNKTVIFDAKMLSLAPAAVNVSPATLTLTDPGSVSLQCMEPVQRPAITLTPDSPPNPPRELPEIDSPVSDLPAVPPTAAKIAIWTDQPGYQLGQPVRLYRSLDPLGDRKMYTVFYYLENLESGRRFYFAPSIGSTELEDGAIDQFGMSPGAFRPARIQQVERELVWTGAPQLGGLYDFVAAIHTADATQVVKTVHAKFVVSDHPPRMLGHNGLAVDIQADEVWSADTIHELRQPVHVRAGATLTIQAGTLIKALGPSAAIIIERGGRIEAQGTRRAPVVMTCDAPVGQRSPGCYGGLTLRGRAPTGDAASGVASLPAAEGDLYGGVDPADSSGALRFVRVEFAGGDPSSRSPRAAIALHGVGSGTVIDHVQAHASLADGIEIRGGAARCRHCVSSGARDDGLAWSQGWLGAAQHVFLRQSLHGNRGIHATGLGTDSPDSQGPTLYNVTLVGGAAIGPSASSADGIALRAGAVVTMRNAVLIGSGRFAVSATDDTVAPFVDGRSSFQNAIVHANGGLYGVAQVQESVSPYVRFIDADPQLRNMRYEANPDPRPMPGSAALGPDVAAVPPADSALSNSQFLGAFGEENWLEEWTFFGPESDYLTEDPSQ
ncbi:MAG: SwmB domain-containing protein [Bryobacterales bacterium]|nr:SwmB domain-containing protein [Bryobacterales bacterium]